MSFRAWVFFAAVGLGASLGSASLSDPPSAPNHGQQDRSQHQEATKAVETKGFPFSWLDAANTYFGVQGCLPNSVHDLSPADQQQQASHHDACDLKAQEIAANSSRWSVWFVSLQTVLTLLATYLVWRSLALNRKAINAAYDAISVTREMGEAQVRAYLSAGEVVGSDISIGGNGVFSLKIGNSGQSPARKCRIVATLQPTKGRGDAFYVRIPLPKDRISKGDMAANSGTLMTLNLNRNLGDEEIEAIRKGETTFIVAGFAIYHDVFGKTRRLTFKFNSEPLKTGATTVSFRICTKGNHSS